MIRTLIVDDETLVRATLRTLVDWEALGYTIVQDCSDGGQALEYLKRNPVDVMFTDMKMPNVGGIELLRGLKESRAAPVSIALSGYDEFELVREAFRLGAYDYLLKSDLNAEILRALLEQLRQKYFQKTETQPQCRENLDTLFQAEQGQYAVVLFSIDDFSAQASRFGSNLHEKLEKPMLELARQIPRLAGRTEIRAVSPERYLLRYRVQDAARFESTLPSVVRQLQPVWRDYMNLSVSAALSDLVNETQISAAAQECEALIRMAPLYGKGAVCTPRKDAAMAKALQAMGKKCDLLLECVCTGNAAQAEIEKRLSPLCSSTAGANCGSRCFAGSACRETGRVWTELLGDLSGERRSCSRTAWSSYRGRAFALAAGISAPGRKCLCPAGSPPRSRQYPESGRFFAG